MKEKIDFHSHILPGLDHGCAGLEVSLAQLEMAYQAGTDVMVATSHFYPERMDIAEFLDHRKECLTLLSENLPQSCPKIAVGAEVMCRPGLEYMDGLEKLCVMGTNCMLLEMPHGTWTPAHYETVDAIVDCGFQVVIAHIDRYAKDDLDTLMDLDVVAQINAESLCSFWDRRRMMHWFKKDRVWALGSDLHGGYDGAYDHFAKAISKLDAALTEQVMARSADLLKDAVYLSKTKIYT